MKRVLMQEDFLLKWLICLYRNEPLFIECRGREETLNEHALKDIMAYAKENKLMRSLVLSNLYVSCSFNSMLPIIPKDVYSEVQEWFKALRTAIVACNDLGIEYILIKAPLNPLKVDVSDVDICIFDPLDIVEFVKYFMDNGYHVHKPLFRQFHNPLKLDINLSKRNNTEMCKETNVDIDIYPGIIWRKVKVHTCNEVLSKSRTVNYFGLKVNVPGVEDDIYIRATHDFYHYRITLGEVLQVVDIIKNGKHLNVEYLVDIAIKNGMIAPLLLIMNAIVILCKLLDIEKEVLEKVHEVIDYIYAENNFQGRKRGDGILLRKYINKYRRLQALSYTRFSKRARSKIFPLIIPLPLVIATTLKNIRSKKYSLVEIPNVFSIPIIRKLDILKLI